MQELKTSTGNSELFSLDVNRKEQGIAGFSDIDMVETGNREFQCMCIRWKYGNGRFQ